MSELSSDALSRLAATTYRSALDAYERGDFVTAAGLCEQVLAAAPAHVEARYKLGNARKEQGAWHAAAGHYREVLRLSPQHAEAMNNLGAVYQMLERPGDAERWYRQAIGAGPALAQPCINLGRMLQSAGRLEEARKVYEAALANGGDVGVFGHLCDALGNASEAGAGPSSARAPEAYVRATFDAFAGDFDRHLRQDLGYRVPDRLATLLSEHCGAVSAGTLAGVRADVLDLGCGTGLVGDALDMDAGSLTGVDLSGQMLEAARRKGRYAALHQADVAAWLAATGPASFDCVIAADVFIYLGELDGIFRDVVRSLRPGGVFAFSVETCEGADYRLLPSGRYAQSGAYLERLAAQLGLRQLLREPAAIRQGVEGLLYIFQRR
jgi:predicted TPR repeat methyltransferase